jgi:hypothetical protein
MSETMIVPWYATGFRADRFEADLNVVAAYAMRYGASSYAVYRSMEDRYRFQQLATFEDHDGWERYWEGPEMIEFRVIHSGWYQIPLLYAPWRCTALGGLSADNGGGEGEAPAGDGNGHGNGARAGLAT